MSEVLLHSLIDKMDAGERKMDELSEKLECLPSCKEVLSIVENKIDAVNYLVEKIHFPEGEMKQLSENMVTSVRLLRQPMKQEIVHYHHASKIIWATAALFLIVCLTSVGWYLTFEKLNMYKANDTKYRYLKLHANKSLNKSIEIIDSLFIANPKLREIIIAKEERNIRDFEMMQRALEMEKEAEELKRKVYGNRK